MDSSFVTKTTWDQYILLLHLFVWCKPLGIIFNIVERKSQSKTHFIPGIIMLHVFSFNPLSEHGVIGFNFSDIKLSNLYEHDSRLDIRNRASKILFIFITIPTSLD